MLDLHQSFNLQRLGGAIKKVVGLSFSKFFMGKTHKVDCPFRVVISERGRWQKMVSVFIPKQLHKLEVEDAFNVTSSEN